MDEAWERAVEQARALEEASETRRLTLDGVVKCAQGRLPPAAIFAPFTQLKHLSIANVGLSSLADFPTLPHLETLILSDNRIAGGLEHLVQAGLKSLKDLDLSNNKIQLLEDLAPLARLKLQSLDLYECPVTRGPEYRAKVFSMMKSLQFLDKADVNDNERPESDEEEEESDDEDVDDAVNDGGEAEGEEEEGIEGDSKGATLQDDEDDEGEEDEERDDDGEENDDLDEEEDEGGSYQEEVVAASGREVVGQVNNDHGSDEDEVDDEEDDNVEVQDIEEESDEEEAGDEDDDGVGEEEEDEDEGNLDLHLAELL